MTTSRKTGQDAALDLESGQRAALLEHLLTIGAALSGTTDLDEVLRLIVASCREITHSDAGSVFLVDRSDAENPLLHFKVAQNDSLPDLQFAEAALPLKPNSLAGHVALTGNVLNLPDAYQPPEGLVFNAALDHENHYRTCSILVVPMRNQQGEVIGVLQLINRKRGKGLFLTTETAISLTQPYSEMEERIVLALASQAAISIERSQLQKSIENLFEGFVHASVQIIEARDPSTAGHSERVAGLTVRLAQEVSSLDRGPFRDVSFDFRQLQEIRYASLLHDFGKVGVPEAILGKAKKLHPQQFEAIRYRFALARRDLELQAAHLRLAHLGGHPKHAHCHGIHDEGELLDRMTRLDRYWQLIVQINEPEVLSRDATGEVTEALREMAQWRFRGLDNQEECLLGQMDLEQLLVNLGNLTIVERQAMQSHVSLTYDFLRRIPWTRALRNVPEIAYGHHEKLDGSGYPLGLSGDRIPLQSQMMTITDIYDALAAGDRPYKKGLPATRTLSILREEAGRSRVNGELVRLFEERRVFEAATYPN